MNRVPLARVGARMPAGRAFNSTFPARITPLGRAPGAAPAACGMCRAPLGRGERFYCRPCQEVRILVISRDLGLCVPCGEPVAPGQPYSLAHRLRRSQGGLAVASNLILAHGLGGQACHGRIDFRRDPRDEARGLTLRSWQDPAAVPVVLAGGRRVLLSDSGRYRDLPAEGPVT